MALSKRSKVLIIGGVVAVIVVIAVVVVVVVTGSKDDEAMPQSPVVSVQTGQIQGIREDGAGGNGLQYAAFLGIPYAQPPTGNLRFKGPKPPISWTGVRMATKEGSSCNQAGLFAGKQPTTGSEDCLVLNVYTPKLPSKSNNNPALPVYFYIHGGGFVYGEGSKAEFGPDFFMIHDIVVVTINYRLNVFGYVNLENDKVPGNAGLKDQIFALKWVKSNIAAFGGDPARVTIGGHSAGAASAHWISILPETQGFFHQAIIQSGNAMQSWGYSETNTEATLSLARHLANNSTLDSTEASNVLMSASEEQLINAYVDWRATTTSTAPGSKVGTGIGPSREIYSMTRKERPIITREPESMLLDPGVISVPVLIGMTNDEWLVFETFGGTLSNATQLEDRINNIIRETPSSLIPYSHTQAFLNLQISASSSYVEAAQKIKAYFFDPVDSECNHVCKMKQFSDEVHMNTDLTRLVRLMARRPTKAPTYLYKFSVKSDYNNNTYELPEETKHSAIHGDEQHYMWKDRTPNQNYYGDGIASVAMRRVTTLFANFIKYGNPTPQKDDLLTTLWPSHDQSDSDVYLEIGETLEVKTDSFGGKHWPFWSELYQHYRDGKSI